MNTVNDYFFEVKEDRLLGTLSKVIYPKPREWGIKFELPEDYYELHLLNNPRGGLLLDLSDCNKLKTANKRFKGVINYRDLGRHYTFKSGVVKLFNTKNTDELIPLRVDDSYSERIKSIEGLYEFLEKKISKIKYQAPDYFFPKPKDFIDKGGVCTNFARFMRNVLIQNPEFKPVIISGGSLNKLIDGRMYYNDKYKAINYSIGHFWVEFKFKSEWWVCDPTIWSIHLNGVQQGTYEYEQALEWLKNNSVYKWGEGPNNLFHTYELTLKKKKSNQNILLSDLEVKVIESS
jgi:hypothetical protein